MKKRRRPLCAGRPEAPYGFVCRLALGTGLRRGELCRVQAVDVKRFRAPGSVEEPWFVEVSQTKSKRIRRVPLSPELLREVRQRVGRLVPYAAGSPGSFAGAVRRSSLEHDPKLAELVRRLVDAHKPE